MNVRGGVTGGAVLLLVGVLTLGASAASAQERESIPGVSLGLVYENDTQPALAIQPFTGRFGGAGLSSQVEAIIGRDLRNSDRFQVMDSLPAALARQKSEIIMRPSAASSRLDGLILRWITPSPWA